MEFYKTNGLFVPRDETSKKTYSQFYYSTHTNCPKCGGNDVSTTCLGIPIFDETCEDTNRATCACGWAGTVHEMTRVTV